MGLFNLSHFSSSRLKGYSLLVVNRVDLSNAIISVHSSPHTYVLLIQPCEILFLL
jgi:hypothetical protein